MQGKPRPGNSANGALCRRHKIVVIHYTGSKLEYCWGTPGQYQETVQLARSPALVTQGVSNCSRTCFVLPRSELLTPAHAKALYLSLRRMYSGGICGSPRLLHRGFQFFRGLTMGTAGWSTIARVVSTTIRKPRTKSTTGEAKREGKK